VFGSLEEWRVLKRAFDVLISGGLLLMFSPFLATLAVLVKREDGGPALYSGTRVGRHGKLFHMHKYRTMVLNADKIGGPNTPDDDPRLTRIGKTLRRCKLDELPQLINVLAGEMSLVGPRPQVLEDVELYTPAERALLSVRPGITDWASIEFRNEGEILRGSADPSQAYWEKIRPVKIRLGLEYVRRQSLWVDLQILAATAAAVMGVERPVPTVSPAAGGGREHQR
jgi:lipopolysaccharide/colanic/teichoic acid biosynthesis glycosyltransferase